MHLPSSSEFYTEAAPELVFLIDMDAKVGLRLESRDWPPGKGSPTAA